MAGEEKELKQAQGHCPKCGPQRYADVVGQYEATETDEVSGVWATTTHRMLRCGGCKTVYFQESYVFSEDYDYDHHPVTGDPMMEYNVKITYWPAPAKRARPEWLSDLFGVDRGLHDLLEETYNVLDVDARVLAATGVRTTFDRASELLGVDPSLSFNEKLDEFLSNGKIGGDERKHLAILTDAGGAAAHRGWCPSLKELNTLMSILEAFIHRNFIIAQQIETLKTSIPPKQKRQKPDVSETGPTT